MTKLIVVFLCPFVMLGIAGCGGSPHPDEEIQTTAETPEVSITTLTSALVQTKPETVPPPETEAFTSATEVTTQAPLTEATPPPPSPEVEYSETELSNMVYSPEKSYLEAGAFSVTFDFDTRTVSKGETVIIRTTLHNRTDQAFTLVHGGFLLGSVVMNVLDETNRGYPLTEVLVDIAANGTIVDEYTYVPEEEGEYLVWGEAKFHLAEEFYSKNYDGFFIRTEGCLLTVQ